MNRKVTHFLATCMQNIGIDIDNEKTNNKFYYTRILVGIAMLLFFFSVTTFAIKNRDEPKKVVLASAHLLPGITIAANYLYAQLTTKRIRNLLRNIDANIFVYTNEGKITPPYSPLMKEKNILLLFRIILVYMTVSLTLYLLSSILAHYITGPQPMNTVIIPLWLPFQSKIGSFLFQLTFIPAFGVSLYLKWIFTLFMNFEYERQCTRLCVALTTLEYRSLTDMQRCVQKSGAHASSGESTAMPLDKLNRMCRTVQRYRNAYHKIVRENLIQCIQHHQRLAE